MELKRLLFVDDDPNVLQGLQRMLRPMRQEWEMHFAGGAGEALTFLARQPFDVVVSDMRMPDMDGAELLNQVMVKYPQTLRMILSGQSERESIIRSVGSTHQYLTKPCQPEQLKARLNQSFALRDLLSSATLREVVSRMKTVPSLPSLYTQVIAELQSPDTSMDKIGRTISRDMGMAARILQLVNSAFFGLRCHVSDPAQAVKLLGLDTIRALILSEGVFSQLESVRTKQFDMTEIWKHGLRAAVMAKEIAKQERSDPRMADDAFIAALLHDVGKVVLISAMTEVYEEILNEAKQRNIPLWQAETGKLGCSHADVGGYLMGSWGLPDPVVEAIAWHHRPADTASASFSALTAVHAANVCAHRNQPTNELCGCMSMDLQYLSRLNLQDRERVWIEICARVHAERAEA